MNSLKKPFPFKLFRNLSKRELQDFLELYHGSTEAETDEDVKAVLHQAKNFFPCHYVVAGLVSLTPSERFGGLLKIINLNYPPEWIHLYVENEHAEVDPVLTSHLRNFLSQLWTNTYKKAGSKRQYEFMVEVKPFGFVNGIICGSLEQERGLGSFFSFVGGSVVERPHYAGVLEFLARQLHRTLIKITPQTPNNLKNGLSARELCVLQWVKAGKTNWEVSKILGITERTVKYHVTSILEKLDVHSRTQAVARALEGGVLSYEELPSSPNRKNVALQRSQPF